MAGRLSVVDRDRPHSSPDGERAGLARAVAVGSPPLRGADVRRGANVSERPAMTHSVTRDSGNFTSRAPWPESASGQVISSLSTTRTSPLSVNASGPQAAGPAHVDAKCHHHIRDRPAENETVRTFLDVPTGEIDGISTSLRRHHGRVTESLSEIAGLL
jgi:hypothetical protein